MYPVRHEPVRPLHGCGVAVALDQIAEDADLGVEGAPDGRRLHAQLPAAVAERLDERLRHAGLDQQRGEERLVEEEEQARGRGEGLQGTDVGDLRDQRQRTLPCRLARAQFEEGDDRSGVPHADAVEVGAAGAAAVGLLDQHPERLVEGVEVEAVWHGGGNAGHLAR